MARTERHSPLESLLRFFRERFAEVHAARAVTVLLLAAGVDLLLIAAGFIKPAREVLILAGGYAEVKDFASSGRP